MGDFLFAFIPLVEVRKQLQNECNYTNHQTDDGNHDRNDLKTCHKASPLSKTIPQGTLKNGRNRPLSRLCSYTVYSKNTYYFTTISSNSCSFETFISVIYQVWNLHFEAKKDTVFVPRGVHKVLVLGLIHRVLLNPLDVVSL